MPDRAGTRNLFNNIILPTLPIEGRDMFRGAQKRITLVETFKQLPQLNAVVAVGTPLDVAEIAAMNAANKHFEINAEGSWTTDDITFHTNGLIRLDTPDASAAANEWAAIRPHKDTDLTQWNAAGLFGSEDSVQMEQVISLPSIVAVGLLFGLKEDDGIPIDMDVIGSDDNATFIHFDDGSSKSTVNFTTVENINTVDTQTDTGIIVEADTFYHLKLAISASRQTRFYINDRLVPVGAAPKDAVNFIPFTAIMTDAAAVKSIDFGPLVMSRAI